MLSLTSYVCYGKKNCLPCIFIWDFKRNCNICQMFQKCQHLQNCGELLHFQWVNSSKTSYIKFFFLELLVSSAAYLCLGPEGVFVGFSNFRHSVGLLVHRALHEGNDNLYDCGNIWHNKKTQWDPTSRNVCQHHLPKLNPACIFVTTCYFSHYLLNGWKFKPLASL